MKNKFFTNEFIRFVNSVLRVSYNKKLMLFVVGNSQVKKGAWFLI